MRAKAISARTWSPLRFGTESLSRLTAPFPQSHPGLAVIQKPDTGAFQSCHNCSDGLLSAD